MIHDIPIIRSSVWFEGPGDEFIFHNLQQFVEKKFLWSFHSYQKDEQCQHLQYLANSGLQHSQAIMESNRNVWIEHIGCLSSCRKYQMAVLCDDVFSLLFTLAF